MLSTSRCRDILALTFFLGSLASQAPQPMWTDTIYPGGDDVADQRWVAIRIVDKLTGKPLPQAEILLIAEASAPIAGELTFSRREVADDDGFISIRVDKGAEDYKPWGWLCVRAPGYCQHMRMGAFDDEVIELSPSVDVPVQIRNWRDEPVSGALVGFCGGCGHTPDLVHGTTGPTGIVTLPGVDLLQGIRDFYVVHPELKLGYTSRAWSPSKQPAVIRLRPGIPHRGIIVDENGMPIAGAAVGFPDVHRGPWARTKGDGTFEVCGLDWATDLQVQHDDRKAIFSCIGTEGLRLQYPLPDPEGRKTVVVPVSDEEYERRNERRDRRAELLELREAVWQKVIVRTVGFPEGGSVEMLTKFKRYELDDLIAAGKPIAIPDDEFVFELTADEHCEKIIIGNREQALRDGVVRLHWHRDTMIEGRAVNEHGESISARVTIDNLHYNDDASIETDVEGGISIPAKAQGLHWLTVRARYSGAIRKMPIELPPRGDDVFVDVGKIVVREESQLNVLGPDGEKLTSGTVFAQRLGFRDWDFTYENDQWWGPDLQHGDYIVIASKRAAPEDVGEVVDVPSRFKIEGAGPWSLRQHAGQILFDIDAAGAQVGATIGEHHVTLAKPTLVRGLKPGTHKVFLSATGRRSAVIEVEVPGSRGQRAELRLALPARK